MKKLMILMAGAMTIGTAANAQISIAPEIGLNLANMHSKNTPAGGTEEKNDGGIKLGVKVGANVNIPIGDHLMVQPGLFYSIKGVKDDGNSASSTIGSVTINQTGSNNVTIHWADIAVNVQYLFNDPGEGRFFIGVGPYLGIAFSGHDKYSSSTTTSPNTPALNSSSEGTYDYKFGNDEPSNDLRRFDFGGQANIGYMLASGIFFRVMGQQSIGNLAPQGNKPSSDDKFFTSQTNITVSIGYNLGGGK